MLSKDIRIHSYHVVGLKCNQCNSQVIYKLVLLFDRIAGNQIELMVACNLTKTYQISSY